MFINKKSDTKDAADTVPTDVKRAEPPKKEKAKPSPAADNRRLLTGVCGACVAVTVAAVGFSGLQYANATKAQREMEGSSIEVVVPADAVPRGTALTADMLTTKRVPKQYVPEDAATKASQVTGRTTLAPLRACRYRRPMCPAPRPPARSPARAARATSPRCSPWTWRRA